MNIRDLQYLTVIAEEKNITKAAKRLYVSQPSLSQVLKKCEDELGCILFSRTTSGLKPTYTGDFFLKKAADILAKWQDIESFVKDVNKLQKGRVIIGIPYYLNGSFVSRVLPLFTAEYPDIDVEVFQASIPELEEMLLCGDVDFILSLPEVLSDRFKKDMIFQCRLLISLPPGSKLHEQARRIGRDRFLSIRPELLEGETLLEYSSESPLKDMTRRLLGDTYNRMNLRPLIGYGLEMVRRCSKSGMGYAVIPESMLMGDASYNEIDYLYIENSSDILYSICAAMSPESELPLAAKRFIEQSKGFFQFSFSPKVCL